MKTIKKIMPFGLAFLPLITIAQTTAVTDADTLFTQINNIISKIVPLFIGIAVIYLLYAAISFITSAEDAEKKKVAQNKLIYGIIALFVMVSIWGLVSILTGTFGFSENKAAPSTTDLLPKF